MIVVTSPTSKIGSQVLAQLLNSGERIRVIARDPARLPARLRASVEVITGSHSQADVVERAFAGADGVFWLVPADPRAKSAEAAYVDFARPGCDAFKRHDVRHVVGVSALGRGWPTDAGHVTATLKMDDMIATTGVNYRALACASFMDNFLRQIEPIRTQGTFFFPTPGDFKAPACATRDIAAVAARLLLEPSWRGVDSIPILGPEDLSCNDMARIISEVLGKPVRFQEMSMEALRAMLTGRGVSEGMAQAMINMMVAKNEGMDHLIQRGALPANVLADTPTSFRQWCEDVLQPAVASH
jgi:uncharacterized protein YbjT (DUF2867 family)